MTPPTEYKPSNDNSTMSTIFKPKIINEVVAKFFIKTLPKISGDPDYESLKEFIQALYTNAATLPTNVFSEKHGHVGRIMKDTLYTSLATVITWEDPDKPESSATITTNSTVAHCQHTNAATQHP